MPLREVTRFSDGETSARAVWLVCGLTSRCGDLTDLSARKASASALSISTPMAMMRTRPAPPTTRARPSERAEVSIASLRGVVVAVTRSPRVGGACDDADSTRHQLNTENAPSHAKALDNTMLVRRFIVKDGAYVIAAHPDDLAHRGRPHKAPFAVPRQALLMLAEA